MAGVGRARRASSAASLLTVNNLVGERRPVDRHCRFPTTPSASRRFDVACRSCLRETHVQHNKKILATAVLAACGGYSSSGIAQSTSAVEEVIVFGTQGARDSTTASRMNLTLLETPATVDVIDGD